jgi:hypothetical protein
MKMLLTALLVGLFGMAMAQDMMATETLAISITNNTESQIFSPPIILNHKATYQLFEMGLAATPELAKLAEDGNASDIQTVAQVLPDVFNQVIASDPVMPGETITLELEVSVDFHYLSLAGMLVTTNDAFFALNQLPIFGDMMADEMMDSDGSMMTEDSMDSEDSMTDDGMDEDGVDGDSMAESDSMMSDEMMDMAAGAILVYDAGSEVNSELCADIPGPPCGNPNVRHTMGAEGVISHHQGIMGTGDLDVMTYGWQEPVATITIERSE